MEWNRPDVDMSGKTQEETEWRRPDVEKQHTIEKLRHGISELLSGNDSPQEEEASEVEMFKLPDKVNRSPLSSSSSDQPHAKDQSQVRNQSTSCRKPRKQTHKHRNTGSNQEQTMFREPARINLQGLLASTTQLIIYMKMSNELEYHRNRLPSADLSSYLKGRFDLSSRDDMAVMSLIQGTEAARQLTGDTQQALTQYKQLKLDMHTCHLTNPGIAEAQIYWHMCYNYMRKGMPGSAHSALQAAVSCIQHHSPSVWTAGVCALQGYMYDGLAQVSPGHRRKHQDVALRCYTNAKEHHLHQPSQEEEDYLYLPILYTTYNIHIKLDMPILNTISGFPGGSDMVYHRLSDCVVTQDQVTEAQDMLRTVTPHIHTLTAGKRPVINERVLICSILLNIRLTQIAIIDKEYISGLKFITTGVKLFDEWCDIESRYNNPSLEYYKRCPNLVRDTKKVLDSLHYRLVLIQSTGPTPKPESPSDSLSSEPYDAPPSTRHVPQQEPLLDSLSSEPSDAPLSGLKQLTDASRRAEKHEFSYSSGDIDTDSRGDVSTD